MRCACGTHEHLRHLLRLILLYCVCACVSCVRYACGTHEHVRDVTSLPPRRLLREERRVGRYVRVQRERHLSAESDVDVTFHVNSET